VVVEVVVIVSLSVGGHLGVLIQLEEMMVEAEPTVKI